MNSTKYHQIVSGRQFILPMFLKHKFVFFVRL